MKVRVYIKNSQAALMELDLIPRVGDEVRIEGLMYLVTRVVWVCDALRPFVSLHVSLLDKSYDN